MVGRMALNHKIGVRFPVPQPFVATAPQVILTLRVIRLDEVFDPIKIRKTKVLMLSTAKQK